LLVEQLHDEGDCPPSSRLNNKISLHSLSLTFCRDSLGRVEPLADGAIAHRLVTDPKLPLVTVGFAALLAGDRRIKLP
jgi:hypothetical protein